MGWTNREFIASLKKFLIEAEDRLREEESRVRAGARHRQRLAEGAASRSVPEISQQLLEVAQNILVAALRPYPGSETDDDKPSRVNAAAALYLAEALRNTRSADREETSHDN